MYDKATSTFVDSKMSVKYEDAHYIAESRGNIYLCGRTYNHAKLAAFLKELEVLGLEIDGDIYTIKPSQITTSSLATRKNWTSLEAVIKEFIDKLKLENKENFSKAYSNVDVQCKNLLKAMKDFSMHEEFSNILDEMNSASAERDAAKVAIDKFYTTNYFKRYLEYGYENIEAWKFSGRVKRLVEKYYPMLSYDKHTLSPNDIGYVQDMDELRKMRQEKLNETILEES
jgi:hypothetical protein